MIGFINGKNRCMKYSILRLVIGVQLLLLIGIARAQNPSIKNLSDKHKRYYDSLKNMNYDRTFPIFGTKVYKRGFDVPFPFGIMVNSFYGVQGIDISNIKIGVKGPNGDRGPTNVDNIVKFSNVEASVLNFNIRADLWVFPFLNIYGLVSYMPYAKTDVTLSEPIELTAAPEQSGYSYGFGVMGAFGFGPVWMQADYNMQWAEMELLENKVFTQIIGVRMGHVFPGKKDPESNFSLWGGAMGIFLNSGTVGSIAMSEIFPDMSEGQVLQARANYNSDVTVTPTQKQIMDEIMDKILDRLHGINVDEYTITYEMDKAPSSEWAGLLGAQYQFNKRWQLRSECNFIGEDRTSILLSINYRFLGFKKKPK